MHGDDHYRPWEIRRMTYPEIELALDADLSKKRPPHGSVAVADPAAYAAWWRGLSRAQKVAQARGV